MPGRCAIGKLTQHRRLHNKKALATVNNNVCTHNKSANQVRCIRLTAYSRANLSVGLCRNSIVRISPNKPIFVKIGQNSRYVTRRSPGQDRARCAKEHVSLQTKQHHAWAKYYLRYLPFISQWPRGLKRGTAAARWLGL
jgi:hypothetical protein